MSGAVGRPPPVPEIASRCAPLLEMRSRYARTDAPPHTHTCTHAHPHTTHHTCTHACACHAAPQQRDGATLEARTPVASDGNVRGGPGGPATEGGGHPPPPPPPTMSHTAPPRCPCTMIGFIVSCLSCLDLTRHRLTRLFRLFSLFFLICAFVCFVSNTILEGDVSERR
jgi:hypothetical protein